MMSLSVEIIRDTLEYREAQEEEKFQSWLEWHADALDIDFGLYEMPELPGDAEDSLDRAGLVSVEAKALSLWQTSEQAFADDRFNAAMRFVYFIGEAFREPFEGQWANSPWGYVIDVPFRASFVYPKNLLRLALTRRTGNELAQVWLNMQTTHRNWSAAGRVRRTEG